MSILSKINIPKDLKKLPFSELQKLNDELRDYTIEVVSKTGGHLGASLGVIELTTALHYVFDAPRDKILGTVDIILCKKGWVVFGNYLCQ
jgi:1-deoxy-D-xylulose-5-phosphate synthase